MYLFNLLILIEFEFNLNCFNFVLLLYQLYFILILLQFNFILTLF
jgi:hypothetical protein